MYHLIFIVITFAGNLDGGSAVHTQVMPGIYTYKACQEESKRIAKVMRDDGAYRSGHIVQQRVECVRMGYVK